MGHDLKQTSLGVFKPLSVHNQVFHPAAREESDNRLELTSLGQETQLGVLGTPSGSLYTPVSTNVRKLIAT